MALASLAAGSAAHAQQARTFENIRIIDQSVDAGDAGFGYIEHAFVVENLSSEQAHRVTLRMPAEPSPGGREHRISRLSRTVELAPGARARVPLLQPPVGMGGRSVEVTIDGRRQRQTFTSNAGGGGYGGRWVSVTRGGSTQTVSVLGSSGAMHVPSISESTRGTDFQFRRHHLPVNQWSRTWLSYTAFAAVAITADEWDGALPEVRSTLLHYTRAGGVLCILGEARLPADARAHDSFQGGQAYALGFGRIVQIDAERLGYELGRSPWRDLAQAASQAGSALERRQGIVEANRAFPVLDDIAVPIRSLFVLLLVFAIVAGPLNLIVLTRKRRRIWLLWTTPLIALIFCSSVFAYSLLSEGVTPTVRVASITLLDQEEHRAVTLGWLAYYAPLTPRGGLEFDDRTELTPQFASDWRETGWSRTVDWSGGRQHLASGWVTPGVPSHFRVRRVDTDRRRLQVERDDAGRVVLVNHLDAAIDRVQFMDSDGMIHQAQGIQPGERATAEPLEAEGEREVDDEREADDDGLRQIFTGDWRYLPPDWNETGTQRLHRPAGRAARPHRMLRPGGYVAVLETSPFIDPALPRFHTREHQSVVIGTTGSADRPEPAPRSEVRP